MSSFLQRKLKKTAKKLNKIRLKIMRAATVWNGWVLHSFYRDRKPELSGLRKAGYLFSLNLAALFGSGLRHNRVPASQRRFYTLKPYMDKPETQHVKRLSYPFMAKKLLVCDVISFDVFDTLLLRPFDDPKTVFYLVGEQLKLPGFARYRVLAEKQARARKLEKNGTNEVTLLEIYEQMNRYFILDARRSAEIEIQVELELIQAHPYMKQIYALARNLNKKIIAVTDMYLPAETIQAMLKKCGYEPDELIVSNEYGVSKRQGGLYEIVKQKYPKQRILHIGDSYAADVTSAQEHEIDTVFMRNVTSYGRNHRAYDMTALVGSAYRGILNNKLCSGAFQADQYYEFGYSYAGLFVLGYCNFIHQKAEREHIDKVFFLSRDGDILKQVYDAMYPDDKTEYVYWSRAAATKLTSGVFRNEYLLRYVKYKISQELTLNEICEAMELPEMAQRMERSGLPGDTVLTKENYEAVAACIIANWKLIDEQRSQGDAAAKRYYQNKIGGAKKICLIDVGWAASGFSALRYLIEESWGLDCEVTGAVAGANYLHDQNIIEAPLLNGKMDAYIFSQRLNRDIKKNHHVKRLYSVFIEMMLASPTPSFNGFYSDENGEPAYSFALPETEGFEMIERIQHGIRDFASDYLTAFRSYPCMKNISGSDAYEVCRFVISRIDYFKNLFGTYPVNRAVGSSGYETGTLGELIEREYIG